MASSGQCSWSTSGLASGWPSGTRPNMSLTSRSYRVAAGRRSATLGKEGGEAGPPCSTPAVDDDEEVLAADAERIPQDEAAAEASLVGADDWSPACLSARRGRRRRRPGMSSLPTDLDVHLVPVHRSRTESASRPEPGRAASPRSQRAPVCPATMDAAPWPNTCTASRMRV